MIGDMKTNSLGVSISRPLGQIIAAHINAQSTWPSSITSCWVHKIWTIFLSDFYSCFLRGLFSLHIISGTIWANLYTFSSICEKEGQKFSRWLCNPSLGGCRQKQSAGRANKPPVRGNFTPGNIFTWNVFLAKLL